MAVRAQPRVAPQQGPLPGRPGAAIGRAEAALAQTPVAWTPFTTAQQMCGGPSREEHHPPALACSPAGGDVPSRDGLPHTARRACMGLHFLG